MKTKLFPINPEGLDAVAESLLDSGVKKTKTEELVNVQARLDNPKDYIRIPNTRILIAKQETHKGKNWEETHYLLSEQGLFMPSPAIFLPYFLKIKEAAEGRVTLYDGSNNPIRRPEADDLYKYMTSAHRSGCWTWLDAKFTQQRGKWYVESNHKVDSQGRSKKLVGTRQPLEDCLKEDAYTDLRFNSQGLAVSKSSNQNYALGSNIYFYQPIDGTVAGFGAGSDGVRLDCLRDPAVSSPGLGVFACAEGTALKNWDKK